MKKPLIISGCLLLMTSILASSTAYISNQTVYASENNTEIASENKTTMTETVKISYRQETKTEQPVAPIKTTYTKIASINTKKISESNDKEKEIAKTTETKIETPTITPIKLKNKEIAEITKTKIETPKVTPVELRDKNRLPDGNTNVISGMPYTTITNHRSQQWALQMDCKPDEIGIQCYYDDENNKYYTAAMGSAYGRTIGDTFHVVLNNGSEFDIMLGEFKDDGSTDFFGHTHDSEGNILLNYDGEPYTCVIEMIYDIETLDKTVNTAGMFNALDFFGGLHGKKGNIKSITYTGQKWKYERKQK